MQLKIGDKIVVFTDIHFGLRQNENRHNAECVAFIEWMIQEAQEFGAKQCIFSGDWHHHRSAVQTSTLNYSNRAFEILSKNFDTTYIVVGNHDMFFRDKRDVHSVIHATNFKNINVINDITLIGDVVLAPWLIGDEHKKIVKYTQPYVFGHFEFPHFLMNAMVAMPDVGHIKADYFKGKNQHVFSGHFHKRQSQLNTHGVGIHYLGNCFPHDFSDSGDDDRGIMLLELGKEPIYKKWPAAPKYRTLNLSELIENPDKHIDSFTIAKVLVDMDLSYEETITVKEAMIKDYNIRELKLIPNRNNVSDIIDTSNVKFESIDSIVLEQLNSIDSKTLDKILLTEIYNSI